MSKSPLQFLIIDDDNINNFLTRMTIKRILEEAEIVEFTVPELALRYIETEFIKEHHQEKVTIFLDINMPTLNAWEFLEKFDTFAESIKIKFSIYILSSSIDLMDIQRAKLNPLVIDFIEKPMSKTVLSKIFA